MGHFTKIVQTGSSKSAGFRHTKHKSNYRCARPTKVCPLQRILKHLMHSSSTLSKNLTSSRTEYKGCYKCTCLAVFSPIKCRKRMSLTLKNNSTAATPQLQHPSSNTLPGFLRQNFTNPSSAQHQKQHNSLTFGR